jgi:futalosine hydrolase
MRILIVAATALELDGIVRVLQPAGRARAPWVQSGTFRGHDVDVIPTGVGMVPTAAWTTRALTSIGYDLALNLGVCGSFDGNLAPGSVVHVVEDRIAELGAEDGSGFLTIDELQLPGESVFVNPLPPSNAVLEELPRVKGITVNTVHGSEASIAAVLKRFAPEVESMEGAAFMCACLMHRVPFAQVRGVSNIVERRNREAWQLAGAAAAAGQVVVRMLERS